jgi:hypothetical protein
MTATTKLSVLSDFVYDGEVSATTIEGDDYDPTGDAVQFAFVPTRGGTPQWPGPTTKWYAGAWLDLEEGDARHIARIVVGPVNGTVQLGVGDYAGYVKVTDDPEIPVLFVSQFHLG